MIKANENKFNIADSILKNMLRIRYVLYGGINRRKTLKKSFIGILFNQKDNNFIQMPQS